LIQWTMGAKRKRTSSSYSAEPAFWADASFGISAPMMSLFGLRQGIRTGVTTCLAVMIRNFDSIGANVHDDRSVADALGGAYGVVNAVSLNNKGRKPFNPCTSRLADGLQLEHAKPEYSGSFSGS
jgi:hypothetical protein